MQQPKNSSLKIAYFILGTFVTHWSGPLKNTIGYLEKSVEEGAREGEFLFSSYAITFTVITKYVMGVPLAEIKRDINRGRENRQRLEHYLTRCIYDIYADHIHQLEEGNAAPKAPSQMEDEYYGNKELFAEFIKLNSDMIQLHRLYLEGEIESAYRLTAEIAPRVDRHKGFVLNVEFLFYSILTRTAIHKDLQETEKQRNKKLIKKYLNELKYWVGIYKGNHFARYLLARAGYDALFKKGKVTEKLYREAIDFAEKQGNLPLAALANLLAAKHFSSDRKLSLFYGKEAVNLYRNWGAGYIADLKAHRIIRYVARTETEVLLNKKPFGGIFAKDPCLRDKDKLSLMCIPIKDLGVLTGIIYLEKWCEDGFGTELSSFVKAFIPALTAGKASDNEINVRSIFCPNDNSLFTDRELEVLRLVATGMSNSDISKHLFITQGTVRNHLSNIYAKLEVDNRVKAVIKAKDLKIIQ
jgi:Response regulator containing a CheY-like receiver domain and an HTH DNA-binding domain